MGSKKPYSGRVFDNFKNKGRRLTGEFKNGKMHGEWTYWREDGKTDREESYLLGQKNIVKGKRLDLLVSIIQIVKKVKKKRM